MSAILRSINSSWLVCLAAFWPNVVSAHAGQGGFVLLLPTGVYTSAGVIVVMVSIVLVGLIPAKRGAGLLSARLSVLHAKRGDWGIFSLISLVVLSWLIFVGLYGHAIRCLTRCR